MVGRDDEIIKLPNTTPKTNPRMSAQNRAAQVSPFAALNGHHAIIKGTERQTETRREL